MKTRRQKNEKGQALILILLAVAGLVGLTALAVDGGHVFATQRQARNAADTAAFAAAIALIDEDPATDYLTDALARAAGNNFEDSQAPDDPAENSGAPIDVIVNWPPLADSTGTPAAYIGNTEYVQVIIAAQVPTFFAPVIGVSSLPIRVQAVTKALPPYSAPLGGDNGLVALGDVCDSINTHGLNAGQVTVTGGGIFSNSTDTGPPGNCWAIDANGSSEQIIADGATMVGCLDQGDIAAGKITLPDRNGDGIVNNLDYDCGATPIPYPPPVPDLGFQCSDLPVGVQTGTTAGPGQWSQALLNLAGNNVFPPGNGANHVDTLEPGVYCITGRFNVGNTETLTSTGPVTFILDGDLTWSAGSVINLIPSNSGKIAGLLIYRPLNDAGTGLCDGGGDPSCQTLSMNAGNSSSWSGTIYAPDSKCRVLGDNTTTSLDAQAICYEIEIGGTGQWTLTYDGADNWDFPYPAQTELNR